MQNSGLLALRRCTEIFILAIAFMLGASPSFAQDDANAVLLQQLKQRDAIINDLLRRVELLERQASAADSRQPDRVSAANPGQPAARAESPPPQASQQSQSENQAPGSVAVDERAADRALERTLTIQGALLLPKGVMEFAPYFAFTRRDTDFPIILTFDDAATVGSQRIERNEYTAGLRSAVGLPFDSQLELDIPYRYVKERRFRTFTGIPIDDFNDDGYSIGDVRIGIAKTLMREEGWKPDLLARFTWDTDTGDSIDNGVPLGNGFNDFRLAFTGLKRQDPLAFTGTVSYTHTLEKNDLQPGDEVGVSLGTSMAASPSTSLSAAIVQSFQQDFKVNNNRVDGTSVDTALLVFGVSSVLGRHTLLAVSAGIGLTSDSPDYTLSVSLPIRVW